MSAQLNMGSVVGAPIFSNEGSSRGLAAVSLIEEAYLGGLFF